MKKRVAKRMLRCEEWAYNPRCRCHRDDRMDKACRVLGRARARESRRRLVEHLEGVRVPDLLIHTTRLGVHPHFTPGASLTQRLVEAIAWLDHHRPERELFARAYHGTPPDKRACELIRQWLNRTLMTPVWQTSWADGDFVVRLEMVDYGGRTHCVEAKVAGELVNLKGEAHVLAAVAKPLWDRLMDVSGY